MSDLHHSYLGLFEALLSECYSQEQLTQASLADKLLERAEAERELEKQREKEREKLWGMKMKLKARDLEISFLKQTGKMYEEEA